MRITRASTGELRLRKPTPSLSCSTSSRSANPHSRPAFPVATVEDGHVGAQEDIAPQRGPAGGGMSRAWKPDKQRRTPPRGIYKATRRITGVVSRPPVFLLPTSQSFAPPTTVGTRNVLCGPCLARVMSHSQPHPLNPSL